MAGVLAFLAGANLARASVSPSCDDRELLRLQISASSNNLANVNTTRTPEGGAYQKRIVIRHRDGSCETKSLRLFKLVRDPANPDADSEGFVRYPDINPLEETKVLFKAREKLTKLKASSSAAEHGSSDVEVDVD
jgi:flagellar basal-body rod protein FlgC